MKKNIKKSFSTTIPKYDENKLNNLIDLINETTLYPNQGLTFWEFYLQQIKFINKKIFILQLLFLLSILVVINISNSILNLQTCLTICGPFLFILGISELTRSFSYKTIELESTTKFNTYEVLLSRITIIGLFNIFIMSLIILIIGIYTTYPLFLTCLHLVVPFMITAFGNLALLNKLSSSFTKYYCLFYSISILIASFILSEFIPFLYLKSSITIWISLFLLSLIGITIQFRYLLKSINYQKLAINNF